ncbi:hypothetical protein CALCODRAFT_173098 [Calocera cornea HHB12733]|uniref:Uncharacterized protein n=1 Tax=Calocera cornea HHB12733 TaxID=1353952 RepID=A0A165HTS6_9BASI|nr:hypothetical protein CALCODRAFT_173098 [Calocera cornea HHB12733]
MHAHTADETSRGWFGCLRARSPHAHGKGRLGILCFSRCNSATPPAPSTSHPHPSPTEDGLLRIPISGRRRHTQQQVTSAPVVAALPFALFALRSAPPCWMSETGGQMARPPRPPHLDRIRIHPLLALALLLTLAPSAYATPTPAYMPQPRGGGTNPITDDPATIPTTPPTSNYQNGVPKIAGSEGGFIGLVVGLGVLLIAACLIVWFLLRRRRARRQKARQSDAGRGGATGLGAAYDAKTSFPKPGKGGLFGGGGNNAKQGWIRSGGGGFDERDGEGIELSGGRKGQGPYLASDAAGAFSSASTIRLAPPEAYKDPYSPGASREELVSPVGEPSPTGIGEGGAYERVGGGQREAGRAQGDSPTSGRFAGGTRFRESL